MVKHVALIEVIEPEDGGAELRDALGPARTLRLVGGQFGRRRRTGARQRLAAHATVRVAAVGSTTAQTLTSATGRPPDLVPSVQRAEALAEELIEAAGPGPARMLVAQGDRAAPTLVDRLRACRPRRDRGRRLPHRVASTGPDRAGRRRCVAVGQWLRSRSLVRHDG